MSCMRLEHRTLSKAKALPFELSVSDDLSDEINDYIYLIYLSPHDEELDTYVVCLHITCLFTIQQKENNKKELHKNEVFKYMISKLVKYNLNKKLQTAMEPHVHGTFLCILSIEDEMNLFTIATVWENNFV